MIMDLTKKTVFFTMLLFMENGAISIARMLFGETQIAQFVKKIYNFRPINDDKLVLNFYSEVLF